MGKCPGTFEMGFMTQSDGEVIPDIWETCSYCGSLKVADVIKAMQIPGTKYSGTDWKYGWPHKFYIDIPCEPYKKVSSFRNFGPEPRIEYYMCKSRWHKFYSVHMDSATNEEIDEWNRIVSPLLGIRFERDEQGIKYIAPVAGYQSDGVVA